MATKKKNKKKKKVSNAVTQMNKIRRTARKIGMTEQTERIKTRNEKLIVVTPPNTPRGKEAHIVESYKKDDSGLATILHAPWNEQTRDFKRTGEAWVNVADSLPIVPGKLYYSEPLRCYGRNFAKNICLHVQAVEWCIRHRPISDVTGTFMVPFRNEKGEHKFVAYDTEGKIVDEQDFFRGLPPDSELVKYVNKFIDTKKGTFARRKKTGAKPMSEKRKGHRVTRTTAKGIKPTKRVIQLKLPVS